jgi:hypothetical protein
MAAKRFGWRPEANELMVERGPRVDPRTWAIAVADAEANEFAISGWVRKALHEYMSQPEKVTPPHATIGRVAPVAARSLRTTASVWTEVAARAHRERTTVSGVVAAAIMFAHGRQGDDAADTSEVAEVAP